MWTQARTSVLSLSGSRSRPRLCIVAGIVDNDNTAACAGIADELGAERLPMRGRFQTPRAATSPRTRCHKEHPLPYLSPGWPVRCGRLLDPGQAMLSFFVGNSPFLER